MHVVVNVESLTRQSGGIGRYTWHLLDGLSKRGLVHGNSCFANYKWLDSASVLNSVDAGYPAQKKRILRKAVNRLRSFPYLYDLYSDCKSLSFRFRTRKLKKSIYHEPGYILKPFPGFSISTIHDLSHLHFPQYHPAERVRYLEKNLQNTLDRSSHIITGSDFVRNEIIQQLGVNEKNVTTIYHGVEDRFRPRDMMLLNKPLSLYNLSPGHYLLFVATIEPRKNIDMMLDAYLSLEKNLRREYPLVLVGSDGWRNDVLKDRIKRLVQKGEVVYIGYVSDDVLPLLFAGARGFVYIPLYEGFGLPPLEAMASGVPVLTSDVSSIPEVVGNAALLINPEDHVSITNAMECLLTDNIWRHTASSTGVHRAKSFSWDKCVDKTIEIYKDVSNI